MPYPDLDDKPKRKQNRERSGGSVQRAGSVAGVIFAVSNDGGKTGVAWRENIHEAFAYLDLQNVNGRDYAVVAVRKPLNAEVSDGGPLTHDKPAAQSRRSLH